MFSLDIRDDLVVGVDVSHSHKVRIISNCATVSVDSGAPEEAVSEIVEKTGYKQGPCVVSLGAENFFFRNLKLPFSDRKKISKMLLYELEETAPTSINTILVDCIVGGKIGEETDVVAIMCDRNFLAEKLAFLQSIGVDPEQIGVGTVSAVSNLISQPDAPENFIFLDVGLRRATVIPVLAGKISFIRSVVFDAGVRAGFHYQHSDNTVSIDRPELAENVFNSFAITLKQTLLPLSSIVSDYRALPFVISGPVGMMDETVHFFKETLSLQCEQLNILHQPLLKLDAPVRESWAFGIMDHALAQAIVTPKETNRINFRKNEFAKSDSSKYVRKGLMMGGVAFIVLFVCSIVFLWADVLSLKDKKEVLDEEILTVFTQTLPDEKQIQDPFRQLKIRLQEVNRSSLQDNKKGNQWTMLDLLSEISEKIPRTLTVKISRLVIDKNTLLLKGTTDNYNSVDSLKKRLEESAYFSTVKINSSNLSPKGSDIRFELKLELGE